MMLLPQVLYRSRTSQHGNRFPLASISLLAYLQVQHGMTLAIPVTSSHSKVLQLLLFFICRQVLSGLLRHLTTLLFTVPI